MAWNNALEVDLNEFDPNGNYSQRELEAYADAMLKQDIRENGNVGHVLLKDHLDSRRRREWPVDALEIDQSITNALKKNDQRPVDASGDGQMMYNRCVDATTQALTKKGWKSFNELQVGDDIWSYDIDLDGCLWLPLQEIFVNEEYDGVVEVLDSYTISARTTPNHRWAVVHEKDKSKRFETTSLLSRHYIPLGRKPLVRSDSLPDDFMELLGWVLTDGTYHQGKGARIYQAIHNPKVLELQRCLKANDINPIWQTKDKNDIGHWYIPSRIGEKIRSIAPEKKLSMIDLSTFTEGQKDSLLRGLILGDGYVRRNERELYSTKRSEIDAAQSLVTIMGITSSVRTVENDKAFCPVEHILRLKENRGCSWAYVRNAYKGQEQYQGTIWCPRIKTGFWVARRCGRVYVTGNTHPRGRKVNSKEQRLHNGASYYGG